MKKGHIGIVEKQRKQARIHRCQQSRSGWDGTDIKALTRRPNRQPNCPAFEGVQRYAHRLYSHSHNARDFGLLSWRAMPDRKWRQQQTVNPEGFYTQYVSTIPCFTCTITNQSHMCHLE